MKGSDSVTVWSWTSNWPIRWLYLLQVHSNANYSPSSPLCRYHFSKITNLVNKLPFQTLVTKHCRLFSNVNYNSLYRWSLYFCDGRQVLPPTLLTDSLGAHSKCQVSSFLFSIPKCPLHIPLILSGSTCPVLTGWLVWRWCSCVARKLLVGGKSTSS